MNPPHPAYVEKTKVEVRITQSGHDPIDGVFCLSPSAGNGTTQTVLELLNSPVRVVPFIVGSDGAVRLLTRLNIDWVIVAKTVSDSRVFKFPVERREEPVEIEFVNGSTILGMIQISGPPSFRVSDFLNTAHDFYPVRTRMGTLLVNKLRVREARLGHTSSAERAA